MAERKQALLIFTKPPIPGIVKTRMTTDYGGFMTMEQAAQFYKCCFFDICEMSMQALFELQQQNDEKVAADPNADKITYDFFCSTTPAESLDDVRALFDTFGPWPMEVNLLVDKGSSFDEHFNDSFSQLFAMGYESIVSIGGDVPTMPKGHLIQGFQWLEYFQSIGKPGFVMAPCQECGTSLVGYSFNTPIDHDGIYYNMDGRPALDGYVQKLQESDEDIPCAYFDPVADIDEVTDLGHSISCMKAIREAARYQPLFVPRRTLAWVEIMGIQVSTPPNENHDPRDYLDGETEVPTDDDTRRINEAMSAIREANKAENEYERSKY